MSCYHGVHGDRRSYMLQKRLHGLHSTHDSRSLAVSTCSLYVHCTPHYHVPVSSVPHISHAVSSGHIYSYLVSRLWRLAVCRLGTRLWRRVASQTKAKPKTINVSPSPCPRGLDLASTQQARVRCRCDVCTVRATSTSLRVAPSIYSARARPHK